MQHLHARLMQNNQEWWSKLMDGILGALICILFWQSSSLVIVPIQKLSGLPGLLVYALALLAFAMFSLQQSLSSSHREIVRVWYGIAGGFLSWTVIHVSNSLGIPVLPNLAGVILLIMVALIVWLLWRLLPVGARYFSLVFMLNWTELVLMRFGTYLTAFSPVFTLALRVTGMVAAFFAILTLGWVLFQTRRRIQRIWGALAIWFLVSLVTNIFWGTYF